MAANFPNRLRLFAGALFIFSCLNVPNARSNEDFAPITNADVLRECSECHMAFQAEMLPKRSWRALIDGLEDHFNEDAAVAPALAKTIRDFFVAHAADANWWNGRFMAGLEDQQTPLRITDTPLWKREHIHVVPTGMRRDPMVRSPANCPACHPRADKGNYDRK